MSFMLSLYQGDITKINLDTIMKIASETLLGRVGVCVYFLSL